MPDLTVQCPECSLRVVDSNHPDVAYERDGNGNILCPNCKIPTKPVGAGQTMAAEDAFREANRELAADPMPPAETIETLTKRLQEIERAHGRVMSAKSTLDTTKGAAKEAKAHFDAEVETFLSLTRRLSAVATPLPLFTDEAVQAAQERPLDGEDDEPDETDVERLYSALIDAGYMAVTKEAIEAWSATQREQGEGWAVLGTLETMPGFMRELMDQNETAAATK